MSDLFDSIIVGNSISIETFLWCQLCALACGLLTALAATRRTQATKSFTVTLILLPMIVTTVIAMVNGSIGTGIAVMGAFSLIRFRSVPGKARDIVAIFLSMTAGLACASGYLGIALVFTALVGLVMVVLAYIPMGEERGMDLFITIPESLRFAGAFDDLFTQYTRTARLLQAKTTNMGSLYKLHYRIVMKDMKQMQAFIDELRCRNGNLEIAMCEIIEGSEEL